MDTGIAEEPPATRASAVTRSGNVVYLPPRRAVPPAPPRKPTSPTRRIVWQTVAAAFVAAAFGLVEAASGLFLCAAATPWLLRKAR